MSLKVFKYLIILISTSILFGCVKHHDSGALDLYQIETEAKQMLSEETVKLSNPKSAIYDLSPEAILITSDGIFIKLDSFYVSESGLFVPRDTFNVNTDSGSDPEFKKLSDSVFSYVIKG